MDLTEGVGESSSPPRSFGNFSLSEIKNEVHKRLLELRNEEACYNPEFRERLDAHFNRLPTRYALDINLDRVEDVLLHQKLLVLAKEADNQPAFHVRFLEDFWTRSDGNDEKQVHDFLRQGPYIAVDSEGAVQSHDRDRNHEIDFEPCSKLEDLNLEVRWNSIDMERQSLEGSSRRQEISQVPVYEVIFSTVDKPKLLSQLSALLSDIGLNIREAHVFSTTDGYSLDVFVVDGWPIWETQRLHETMENAIARSEGSWSSQLAVEKALVAKTEFGDWEIGRRMLKIGEKIASGACGDLHRGAYLGEDVAVKMLRSEQQTEKDEFLQEVSILREVKHENVIRLIGVCTKSSPSCIITEYMAGGSLYEYLRKNGAVMELPQLVKFAIDVSKGMEYLHQQNIIHRDLKTANLLIDAHNVVKVADFGIARFRNEGDVMTAETGTYRWMAPEILNNQQYDQRADIFSFAIVLWELVTAKVPYDTMTPLQAALGVTRQNIRPEIPRNMHPKLLDLMQRCWDTAPAKRPSFSQIRFELEELLQKVQEESDVPDVSTIHVQLKHP